MTTALHRPTLRICPRTYLVSCAISGVLWLLMLLPPDRQSSSAKPLKSPNLLQEDSSSWTPFRFRATSRTRLIRVTSLANQGPGTLRSCISETGSRVCVFEVGGVIPLLSSLIISEPHLLVAGQTAPDPGITLMGSGIRIATDHVQIEHLAIRPGDDPLLGAKPVERDAVSIGAIPPESAHHVTLRHLSLTWAIDENLSTWYSTTDSVHVSNSIIAEGLHRSIHPKGPHSKGALIGYGSQRVVLRENLLAFNDERNPYVEPGSSVALINNVIYGWGPRSASSACNLSNNDRSGVPVVVAVVGNFFMPGPTSFRARAPVYARYISPTSLVFARKNLAPYIKGRDETDWSVADLSAPEVLSRTCPLPFACSARLALHEVETSVLRNAGSRPAQRSPIDRRIVQQVRSRTGDLKDCISGCTRAAEATFRPIRPTRRALILPKRNIGRWLQRFSRAVERVG